MAQLKRDDFAWNEAGEQAFHHLKNVMTSIPVLALPDFAKLFMVEADASGWELGAVLMQDQIPIAYSSHILSP